MTTSVNVSANLVVAGQPVTLSSQDIAGGIVFTLPHPVTLGTPGDFLKWFIDMFNPPAAEVDKDTLANVNKKIAQLPPPLSGVADTLLNHDEIVLDTLVINTVDGIYQFGISMHLVPPMTVVSSLQFEGIGFYFEKKPASTTLTADVKATDDEIHVAVNPDVATFKVDDVLKIDNERMTINAPPPAADGNKEIILGVTRSDTLKSEDKQHLNGTLVLDVMPAPPTQT